MINKMIDENAFIVLARGNGKSTRTLNEVIASYHMMLWERRKGNRMIAKHRRITRDVGYLFYRYPKIYETLEHFDLFKRRRKFLKRYLEGMYA